MVFVLFFDDLAVPSYIFKLKNRDRAVPPAEQHNLCFREMQKLYNGVATDEHIATTFLPCSISFLIYYFLFLGENDELLVITSGSCVGARLWNVLVPISIPIDTAFNLQE